MANVLARNAVSLQGDGSLLAYAHGYGCDQQMWRALIQQWPHRAITYDLTGMGSSDYAAYDEAVYGDLQGHAQDLVQVLDAVDEGPVVAVGHSVSAMICALASIERPDLIRALVMICPNPCYINDPPYEGGFERADIEGLLDAVDANYIGWSGQLAGMVGGPDAPGTVTELNDRFCRNDPLISRHFARTTFLADNRADLARVSVPTLIVDASQDAIAPPAVGAYVQQHIEGARRVTIACRGHAPHMTHPRETGDAIRAFVEAS